MITWEKGGGGEKETCTEELEEKRNRFGDMATLCTEIGMPKYRENKKKWKSFLPGNIPANICHRQCLVCEGVCVLYSRCHQRVWAVYSLPNVRKYIFMLCESVYIRVPIQQTCVFMWSSLNVCGSMHSRTRVLVVFLCTSNTSSPHFLHILSARVKERSLVRMRVCARPARVF